ncbi:MAG: hypothetical protein IPI58_09705 [Alphaproteobacteria bacterium]|nr:MAG: hypothetical protein IPI58_09705 [Alphaproteobacteria bacterium]
MNREKDKEFSWAVSPDASFRVSRILARVKRISPAEYRKRKEMDWEMDLVCAHIIGAVDLSKLMEADAFTFLHDVFGIAMHLDREKYCITNCFIPRCAPAGDEQ